MLATLMMMMMMMMMRMRLRIRQAQGLAGSGVPAAAAGTQALPPLLDRTTRNVRLPLRVPCSWHVDFATLASRPRQRW